MTKRSKGNNTDTPAAMPAEQDDALRMAWAERVHSQRFGDGVLGARAMRVFGRSGDEAVYVPLVESLAVLERDPVAHWAVAEAEQIIRAKQARGAQVHVLASPPDATGFPLGRVFGLDEPLDPTQDVTYLVLSRVVGG
jgi:hypothetical protein